MLNTLKIGTVRKIMKTTKIQLNDKMKNVIDEIFSKLHIDSNGTVIVYGDGLMSVSLGRICTIHDMIIKYLLDIDNYNSFSDFIQQRPKNRIEQIQGHEDLVVDGMEERYINEEYAPKDEIKIELPKPLSLHDKIECPVCCELVAQVVKCKECKTTYCYQCCVQQAKRTGRCPMCNKEQSFE